MLSPRKAALLLINLILITACGQNSPSLYDVDGPELSFTGIYEGRVLYQFNEPLRSFSCRLQNRQLNIIPSFPLANIYLPQSTFPEQSEEIEIEAVDCAGNSSLIKLPSPPINLYPASFQFEEIRPGYSKKLRQRITLRCTESGSSRGFRLVLFIRGKRQEVPFADNHFKRGELIHIELEGDKSKDIRVNIVDKEKSGVPLYFPYRLSQLSALIYILNSENRIIDNFLYFNSKSKKYAEIISNKNYNYYCRELESYGVKPTPHDINGHSTKKTVRRVAGGYRVGL